MYRRGAICIGGGILAALLMTACHSGAEYRGVCEQRSGGARVPDAQCQSSSAGSGFAWVYYQAGRRIPAVGDSASDGISVPPQGASVSKGGVADSGESGAQSGSGSGGANEEGGSGSGGGDEDGGSGGGSGGGGEGGGSGGGEGGGSGGGGGGGGE